jgi:steroid 5-alpha reductase family enzyme
MSHAPSRPDRADAFGWIALVYVIAASVAWIVMATFEARPVLGMGAGMLASVAVTYLASIWLENGSVFDPWWSVLPPVVALHLVSEWTPLASACVLVVSVWAVRLTLNWAMGWPGLHHEDWRYAVLYERFPLPRWLTMLLAVDLLPAVFVFLGSLPLVPALQRGGELGFLGLAATALGLAAAGLELAADEQRRGHALARPRALMDAGLWAWCRHPNYLGEILFWVSLWLFGLAADPAAFWWTALGPLAIVGLFLGGSRLGRVRGAHAPPAAAPPEPAPVDSPPCPTPIAACTMPTRT